MKNPLAFIFMITWDEFFSPMGENLSGIFGDNGQFLGLIIFLFFLMFILMLRFTIPLVAIIFIPLIFFISEEYSLVDIRVLAGITFGIIFGIALVKWFKRV
jgi:hypothetical protein